MNKNGKEQRAKLKAATKATVRMTANPVNREALKVVGSTKKYQVRMKVRHWHNLEGLWGDLEGLSVTTGLRIFDLLKLRVLQKDRNE